MLSQVILTFSDNGGLTMKRRSVMLNPLMYELKVGERFPLIFAVEGFDEATA